MTNAGVWGSLSDVCVGGSVRGEELREVGVTGCLLSFIVCDSVLIASGSVLIVTGRVFIV